MAAEVWELMNPKGSAKFKKVLRIVDDGTNLYCKCKKGDGTIIELTLLDAYKVQYADYVIYFHFKEIPGEVYDMFKAEGYEDRLIRDLTKQGINHREYLKEWECKQNPEFIPYSDQE